MTSHCFTNASIVLSLFVNTINELYRLRTLARGRHHNTFESQKHCQILLDGGAGFIEVEFVNRQVPFEASSP